MPNISSINYSSSNQVVDSASAIAISQQGSSGFGSVMGQVSSNTTSLTPSIAKSLMYRSMTTGVPTAELDKYGGYDAVKAMFEVAGGTYSLDAIPTDQLEQFAQQVSNSGTGNLSLIYKNPISLTKDIAQSLIQRSNTTGVPKPEMDLYGGYDAIKAMYDQNNSSPVSTAPPHPISQDTPLEESKVAQTTEEPALVSAAVIQTLSDQGIDLGTQNKVLPLLAQTPFVDTSSYIDAFMSSQKNADKNAN